MIWALIWVLGLRSGVGAGPLDSDFDPEAWMLDFGFGFGAPEFDFYLDLGVGFGFGSRSLCSNLDVDSELVFASGF